MPKLPIVAQPGAATIATASREPGFPTDLRHKRHVSTRRDSRRVPGATQHKIFFGYTHDRREAESLYKPEIAWCEQNCQGLWTIMYGPYVSGLGYEVRFGFTLQGDAQAFARWREAHHARDDE